MDLRSLQQRLKGLSFEEQYPELAEKARELAEKQKRILSQPSAVELLQAEMQRAISNFQRQSYDIQMKVQEMISDEKE